MPQQILSVDCEIKRLRPPIAQTEEDTNAQSPEARGISALRRFQSPVEIPFWPSRMHAGINGPIVGFLVNDEALGSSGHQRAVLVGLQRTDLKREGGNFRTQSTDTLRQII